MNDDRHQTEPCPRCGEAHDEHFCSDERDVAAAMQMACILAAPEEMDY